MKKILPLISTLIIFAFMAVSCLSTTTSGGEVGADRNQLMLISSETVELSSKQSYEQVLAEAKSKGVLNKNASTTKRVQTIANKIINETKVYRTDALSWNWQINVITDSEINAWCLPGGRIVVYTGIIDTLKLTDSELAAVLGHEISHALREHSREQLSRQTLTEIGAYAFSSIFNMNQSGSEFVSLCSELIITLPFSRSQETEADNMGTELMARAGYDPYDAVKVWQKMNKLTTNSTPEILSTHPSNESRIQNLNHVAAKVYPLYKK
ncbi:M48 family metallopeptidase [Treponema sp.]|uniref:M48 family metallopeptidase n=1 Tax=Treponema sp. TaxID=166 RepID=UPI00298EA55C|nr:M48 family metallopeptidase [Treponema sp.]